MSYTLISQIMSVFRSLQTGVQFEGTIEKITEFGSVPIVIATPELSSGFFDDLNTYLEDNAQDFNQISDNFLDFNIPSSTILSVERR